MIRSRSLLLVLALSIFYTGNPVRAASTIDFFYFFPDSTQSNFSLLKQNVDEFFNEAKLDIQFQAFTHEVDFERLVRQRKPGMVLVPAWYFKQHGKELALKPLVTALRQEHAAYHKALLIRKNDAASHDRLDGKTVAVTNMGPDADQQLNNYFSEHEIDFTWGNIVITPKDADAFYALVLGQVDAAIVSIQTIQVVGRTNPRLEDMVHKLATSSPIPMPLLCITENGLDEKQVKEIKRLLLRSGKQLPPPSFMQMLHISGWIDDHK